jgi:hypothetical protein
MPAVLAEVLVVLVVLAALSAFVFRARHRTEALEPAAPCGGCNLDCDDCACLPPADLYEHTVREHGDPRDLELVTPAFVWPE